jgi:two-component system cell cycle sensor histidine kinase/response regulator CckA
VRIIGMLSLALALAILVAVLAMYYQGGHGSLPTERGIGSAIAFCLLLAAGFTIVRVTGLQEKLIGELRKSEHKTAEFRDLLHTTLCSIGDAVIVTDAKGIITFLNPVAKKISGWAGEAIGQPLHMVFAITHQFTGEIVEDPAAVVLREGNVGSLAKDTVLTSKDGRLIPVGDSSAPIRDQAGSMVGVVLVFRDLTAPKAAEELQLKLASIVESSDDAIIGEDPDGTITSWNDAATRIFGYSAEEMIGTNITALTPEGRADDSFEVVQRIQRGEHVRHYETVRRRKGGTEIAVDLSISPIRDAAGHVVGASKIARDITDRKRTQEQIVYSQKIESLGVLAGGVAHDFNNLLMAISANTTLILDEVPPRSATADLAGNVLIATEQASHLTRQMLHYSGKGRFAVEPISLTKQIEDIVLLFRSAIPKGIKLRLELDPNLPPIIADAGQVQQLVTNLVLNAAEAIASDGVVTITASLQELSGTGNQNLAGNPVPPGTYAMLEVRDTGNGMDEATQARIFDPFFTTKFTGRGLGLAAVLGIVRGHRGGISVSSQPGKGTLFQVFFPVEAERRALHAKI